MNNVGLDNKGATLMAATENRMRALVDEHLGLGREANLDGGFSDAGVSSVDAVAFMRVVEREFGVTIPPEDCAKIGTFRALVGYLNG